MSTTVRQRSASEIEEFSRDMLRTLRTDPEDPKLLREMAQIVRRFSSSSVVLGTVETRDELEKGRKIRNLMAYLTTVIKRVEREAATREAAVRPVREEASGETSALGG